MKDFNHEHVHEGEGDCDKEESFEFKLQKYTVMILEKMIISRKSLYYKIEQIFILVLCVFSSYYYMYFTAFGQENH